MKFCIIQPYTRGWGRESLRELQSLHPHKTAADISLPRHCVGSAKVIGWISSKQPVVGSSVSLTKAVNLH